MKYLYVINEVLKKCLSLIPDPILIYCDVQYLVNILAATRLDCYSKEGGYNDFF